MSMMLFFRAVLFPTRCLGWDLELNWVSFWGFSFLLFYIKRERERERERVKERDGERKRAWVRVCLHVFLQYKALYAVLYKWPYLGTGMAQIRLRICAIWPDSSFFAYHLRRVYIHKTHTGLQEIQKKKKKKKKKQQLHVAGHYNAEISLHKAIPFSIQHLYCLKYKTYHFSNKT